MRVSETYKFIESYEYFLVKLETSTLLNEIEETAILGADAAFILFDHTDRVSLGAVDFYTDTVSFTIYF